jgi:hypothetical protein
VTVSGAPSNGGNASVAAYEQLRSQALLGATSGSHFGLILLLREGIAAWIAHGRIDYAPNESVAKKDLRSASSRVPGEIHAGIVGVLANMAMANRREMRE